MGLYCFVGDIGNSDFFVDPRTTTTGLGTKRRIRTVAVDIELIDRCCHSHADIAGRLIEEEYLVGNCIVVLELDIPVPIGKRDHIAVLLIDVREVLAPGDVGRQRDRAAIIRKCDRAIRRDGRRGERNGVCAIAEVDRVVVHIDIAANVKVVAVELQVVAAGRHIRGIFIDYLICRTGHRAEKIDIIILDRILILALDAELGSIPKVIETDAYVALNALGTFIILPKAVEIAGNGGYFFVRIENRDIVQRRVEGHRESGTRSIAGIGDIDISVVALNALNTLRAPVFLPKAVEIGCDRAANQAITRKNRDIILRGIERIREARAVIGIGVSDIDIGILAVLTGGSLELDPMCRVVFRLCVIGGRIDIALANPHRIHAGCAAAFVEDIVAFYIIGGSRYPCAAVGQTGSRRTLRACGTRGALKIAIRGIRTGAVDLNPKLGSVPTVCQTIASRAGRTFGADWADERYAGAWPCTRSLWPPNIVGRRVYPEIAIDTVS